MKTLICAHCKLSFEHKDARTKYCSLCSKISRVSTVKCDVCGSIHQKKKSKISKNSNNFCSTNCKNSIEGRKLLDSSIKNTILERYGKQEYFQTNDFKQKSINTQISKYGDLYVRTDEYIKKKEESCINRFGSTDAMKCDIIKEKAFKSHRENRYEEFSKQIKDKHISLLSTKEEFSNNNISYKCDICGNIWESEARNIQHVFCDSNNCKIQSVQEHEIFKFISDNCNYEIISQYKLHINNKVLTLDIFIKELNLVVEYHGLYWHSTKFRHKNYHKDRHTLLTNAGYQYIQIFSHEWDNRKDAVKGILLNKLGKSKIMYARKLSIREVSNEEYNKFMNDNHVQGTIGANVKIGLYDSNSCIQIISFTEYSDRWECARLCTQRGINVVGGFNRLLKEFNTKINTTNKKILSYVNLRYFSGSAYIKAGFKFDGNTEAGYFYTNGNAVLSRQKCQKHKLKELISNYDESCTEEQNMINNKYYRVYDSGNARMIFNQFF